MPELLNEVSAVLLARPAAKALSDKLGIDAELLGAGVVLGVPVLISALSSGTDQEARGVSGKLSHIDVEGLDDLASMVLTGRYDDVGNELAELLIGRRRDLVVGVIANEVGLAKEQVRALLNPMAWSLAATIVRRYGRDVDYQALQAIGKREHNELIEEGWGPWLDAVDQHQPVSDRYDADRRVAVAPADVNEDLQRRAVARADGLELSVPVSGPPMHSIAAAVSEHKPRASARSQDHFEPETQRSSKGLLLLAGVGLAALVAVAAVWWVGRDGNDIAVEPPLESASTDELSIADDEGGDGDAEGLSTVVPRAEDIVAMGLEVVDPEDPGSPNFAFVDLNFDRATGQICYLILAAEVPEPFDMHIHAGSEDTDGDLLVDFGPLFNNAIGCTPLAVDSMDPILDDLDGYYIDIDPGETGPILRAQLSTGLDPEDNSYIFDPRGGGAITIVEAGRIVLEGEVSDQLAADLMLSDVSGLDPEKIEVVNNLTIDDNAPFPSGLIIIRDSVLFDVDSDGVDQSDGSALDVLATLFMARSRWTVTIVGHADSSGSATYNRELSIRRADAVMAALVERGVDADALEAEGAGESDPLVDNDTTENRALNRRTEFYVDAPLDTDALDEEPPEEDDPSEDPGQDA